MPSFRYFELDVKGSAPFLKLKANEEISTGYQLPMPDVYTAARTSVKCMGQSASSGYIKYLVRHQDYLRPDGKHSTKPSFMVATRELYIFKPVEEDYIFVKGEQKIIRSAVKVLSDYNLLKVKYHTINISRYEEENGIEISGGWISDDFSTVGYFKKANSREYLWLEKKAGGGSPSNIVFPVNLANTSLTVRLNRNGNIFFPNSFDEEFEFHILDSLFSRLSRYMVPAD